MDKFRVTLNQYKARFLFMIVLACGLWSLRGTYAFVQSLPNTDIVAGDLVDTRILVNGLKITTSVRETLDWWVGPWIAGKDYPFYRPLSSLLWWIEYQIFGAHGLYGFMIIHALSHLIVLTTAFCFLRDLLGLRVAALSLCLYALGIPSLLFGFPSIDFALTMWKDDPDLWCSAVYLASLQCFLRFTRDGSRWHWGASLILFVAALCFKEMAYTLPFVLVLMMWHERVWSRWKFAIPFYLVALGAFAFRWWALQGWGFRFGSNGAWRERWLTNVIGGAPATQPLLGQSLPLGIACCAIVLLCALAKAPKKFTILCVVSAAASVCLGFHQNQDFEDPIYLQLFATLSPWKSALSAFVLLILMWRFVVNRRRGQLFGWFWVLITYIPLMTAPVTQHAFYLVSLGWSIWLAHALIEIEKLKRLVRLPARMLERERS